MHTSAISPSFLTRFLTVLVVSLVLLVRADPPNLIGRKLIDEKVKLLEPKAEKAAIEVLGAARRQLVSIENAKVLWTLENLKKEGKSLTPSDLQPHFAGGDFPIHYPGGEFVINPIGTPPSSTAFGTADELMTPPGFKRGTEAALRVVLGEAMVQLMMIESAKERWALENKKAPGAKVYEADLLPYFLGGEAPTHSVGGKFVINPVGTPPESTAYGKLADFSVPAPIASKAGEIEALVKNTVINQLRIIEGAKDQWSLDHLKSKRAKPEETDLLPYLPGRQMPVHPPGGKFIINPLGTPAESTVYGKLP